MAIASQMLTPALSTSTSIPACFSASAHCSLPRVSKSVVPCWHLPLHPDSFSTWSGLKLLGVSHNPKPLRFDREKRCRGMVVYASLFGVGAPEALVIGVVALLVFGPKGLAEEVSREFKSTLEKEIGVDEISEQKFYSASKSSPIQSTSQNLNTANDVNPSRSPPEATSEQAHEADTNASPGPAKAYPSEDLLKITKEQLNAAITAKQQQQALSPQGGVAT